MSDCKYFTDGFNKRRSTLEGNNADLWYDFWNAYDLRTGSVRVKKVKAHAEYSDIMLGLVTINDFLGNQFAGTFAGEAAQASVVSESIAANFATIDGRSWKIQTRLVEVLIACRTRDLDKVASDFWKFGKALRVQSALADKSLIIVRPRSFLRQQHVEIAVEVPSEEGNRISGSSIAVGGSRSSCFHPTHKVVCTRGLHWCARCGAFATVRGRKLLIPCVVPSKDGLSALRRLKKGRTPTASVTWPISDANTVAIATS
jgi:hypothetical protein